MKIITLEDLKTLPQEKLKSGVIRPMEVILYIVLLGALIYSSIVVIGSHKPIVEIINNNGIISLNLALPNIFGGK